MGAGPPVNTRPGRPIRGGARRAILVPAMEPASRPEVSDPAFWERKYAQRRDGWELRGPPPPLVHLLAQAPPPRGRVAVPGCGRGHDARLFAALGYPTWGFDFAPAAIEAARALAAASFRDPGGEPAPLTFEQRDLFSLPDAYPAFFDLVWEYTCFCAVDPVRRPEYVEVLGRILRPGGRLLALFFPVEVEWHEQPPFSSSRAEIRRLLEPAFRIDEAIVPADSAPGRRGAEWLVRATLVLPAGAAGARA